MRVYWDSTALLNALAARAFWHAWTKGSIWRGHTPTWRHFTIFPAEAFRSRTASVWPCSADGHGLAAYCRVTPPHPGKGNAEKLKPNPCPPPLPISAFQYFSFCPGGFIVATAVFRFNQRNPLFPGTQWRIGFKNLLTGGIRCQELRSQSGTKPGNLRHGKVGYVRRSGDGLEEGTAGRCVSGR